MGLKHTAGTESRGKEAAQARCPPSSYFSLDGQDLQEGGAPVLPGLPGPATEQQAILATGSTHPWTLGPAHSLSLIAEMALAA